MKFGWETKRERILRGKKISPLKKLEGMRLLNEMADKILTRRQQIMRRKLRESGQI